MRLHESCIARFLNGSPCSASCCAGKDDGIAWTSDRVGTTRRSLLAYAHGVADSPKASDKGQAVILFGPGTA